MGKQKVVSVNSKRLGTNVGKHLCCANKAEIDLSIADKLMQPTIAEINMLSLLCYRTNLNKPLGTSIVGEQSNR